MTPTLSVAEASSEGPGIPPTRFVATRKIAYLLSQYPAVSHTFFLNEVLQLRSLRFQIETASINAAKPPPDGFSAKEKEEAQRTFYVKSQAKTRIVGSLCGIIVRHPRVVWRGIREAMRLDPWNAGAAIYNLFYLAEALLLGRWMREKQCTHLHVHFSGPVATVALLASVSWEISYSLTAHGPDEFYNLDKFHLRRKLHRASFVFCISDFCRSQLLRISPPGQWSKIHVCRLGVDETMFFPEPCVNGSVRLVSIGRLHPSKGHLILFQAVRELRSRGWELTLDLVGGGEDRQLLEDFARENGLSQQITIHGPLSHTGTRALLKGADLFVLASFAEGVPVALMEAMAMEIACVSTQVAGIPELIRNGVDGVLVAPSSVAELVEALHGLISDPQLRRRLAASGRRRVLEHYNLAKNAQYLAETFSTSLREVH